MPSIKTSIHSLEFSNTIKQEHLAIYLTEYRRVAQMVMDHIWEHGYEWETEKGQFSFSIQENHLMFPMMMKGEIISRIGIETFLSARSCKCLLTQVAGMITAEVVKQRKRLYILDKLKSENKSKHQRQLLGKKLKQNIPVKPSCANIRAELNSICCEFTTISKEFDGFIKLSSLVKRDSTVNIKNIKIPIRFHKHSLKLSKDRIMMTSFLIGMKNINIRWIKAPVEKRTAGVVIGCDQGLKTILTCSNKQTTPHQDQHGHTLESILRKLSSKKSGSNAFKKAQDHRKNFINWSINQLNFDDVKEIRLERIWNIGYKNKTSRMLSHWTNTLIRDKVEQICEDTGVQLIHQSSTYRSQRCSGCGVVRKSNRKGKVYTCKHCSLVIDADLNASLNHAIDLPEIPYDLRKMNFNRSGFFWLESGFYDSSGRSLQSLPPV
jgi:putative transposase